MTNTKSPQSKRARQALAHYEVANKKPAEQTRLTSTHLSRRYEQKAHGANALDKHSLITKLRTKSPQSKRARFIGRFPTLKGELAGKHREGAGIIGSIKAACDQTPILKYLCLAAAAEARRDENTDVPDRQFVRSFCELAFLDGLRSAKTSGITKHVYNMGVPPPTKTNEQ